MAHPLSVKVSDVQYWQLIGIPRPITSPNLYPNLLQLPGLSRKSSCRHVMKILLYKPTYSILRQY